MPIMGEILGQVSCTACGHPRGNVKTGKNGTLSVSCTECGALTMVKSPKAVGALRERLGGAQAPAPAKKEGAPAPAADGQSFDDFMKG